MTLRYTWGGRVFFQSRVFDRLLPGIVLVNAGAIGACSRDKTDLESHDLHELKVASQPLSAEATAPGSAGASASDATKSSASAAAAASASTGDRPNIDENMGRGFQGKIAMRLLNEAHSQNLRYMSHGNTARLQLDALEQKARAPSRNIDALIWGDSISLLDHRQRTIQTTKLDEVAPRAEQSESVEVKKTGERGALLGVICERYEIREGSQRISACVSALPGTFDVDKLEAASQIDVPGWVEQLLKDKLLPLQGTVRDAAGRELHSFELVEYSPGPVDDAQLALPQDYEAVAGEHKLGSPVRSK